MVARALYPILLFGYLAVTHLAEAQQKRQSMEPSGRPLPGFDLRLLPDSSPNGRSKLPEARFLAASVTGEAVRQARAGHEPATAARQFLIEHSAEIGVSPDQVGQYKMLRSHTNGSATVVDFQQTIDGIPVFEGHVKVALGENGQVTAATLPARIPSQMDHVARAATAEESVRAAFRATGLNPPGALTPTESHVFPHAFQNPLGLGGQPIFAEQVAFPLPHAARLAWRVLLDVNNEAWYEVVVDAENGRLLYRQNLQRQAGTARVWRVAPDSGTREIVALPDAWLPSTGRVTTGNFADAYLDRNSDGRPDADSNATLRGGRALAENQVFDFSAPDPALNQDPRAFGPASVTNAFYFANLAHDYFYRLGFDEAAGNMQQDNGGKPGKAADPVLVEVQTRAGFGSSVPTPDGVPPRIKLGFFTRGTASLSDDRDLAYSGQIVFHEFTHLMTGRLTGGGTSTSCLSGVQSRALDEGWSDYFAASFFNNPVQGSFYSRTPLTGIRRQSYEGYTFTYEDLGNQQFQEHLDGEIWAATLWDLRKDLGAALLDPLVVQSLKMMPCRPTFVDARDALLAADQALNRGVNRTRIYRVFARHGMGVSAAGVDGIGDGVIVFNANFDLPADLQMGNSPPLVTSKPAQFAASGEIFTYQILATDADGGTLRYELITGPAGMTVDPATGIVRWTAGFTSVRVKISVSDGQGGKVIHGFLLPTITQLTIGKAVTISAVSIGGIASVQVPADSPVLQVTLREGRGDADMTFIDPAGGLDFGSPSGDQYETVSFAAPIPGRWLILVTPYLPFEGVQLMATLPVPKIISGNARTEGVSGETSSETFYRVIVPPGANNLLVTLTGGSGDADLVVMRGRVPVCQAISSRCFFETGSFRDGNNESISIPSPQPGDWYINVTSYTAYSGAVLTTQMDVRPTLILSPIRLAFQALRGLPNPPAQILKVSDPSGSRFIWTAAAAPAVPWLKMDKTGGTGDSDLAVSVDATGLGIGSYSGTFTVSAVGLGQSPQTIVVTLAVVSEPVISGVVPELVFNGVQGQDPPPQRLSFSNTGGGSLDWTISTTTATGGNWLSASPTRGSGNGAVQVLASAGTLAPGSYQGTLTLAATGATSVVVRVRYSVAASLMVKGDSLRSVASRRAGPVSPGDMLMVEGSDFIELCSLDPTGPNPCPRAEGFPLPVELAGLRVLVNGVPAPLLLVFPGEIRFIVPFEAQGGEAVVVISRRGFPAPPIVRPLARQSIAVFTMLENGAGAGRILHADGSPVSREAPLAAEETVNIVASGLGIPSPAVATGAAAPSSPTADVMGLLKVLFDGAEGTVLAAFLEPGAAGVYRVIVTAPSSLARPYPEVVIQGEGAESAPVSAGGPTLLDVMPAAVKKGTDATLNLRGINLPADPGVSINGVIVPASLSAGLLQTATVVVPAALLEGITELVLKVVNPSLPEEPESNPVAVRVE